MSRIFILILARPWGFASPIFNENSVSAIGYRLSAIFVVASLLIGCTATNQRGSDPTAELIPTESSMSSAARSGELIFVNGGCAGCHSTGTEQKVGPGLAGFMAGRGTYGHKLPNGQPLNDANLMQWIRDGNSSAGGLMPGNPGLSDKNLSDLIAFLKTLE